MTFVSNNLKQAHTNTIYNICVKKLYCLIRNVREEFLSKLIRNQNILSQKYKKKVKMMFWESLLTNETSVLDFNQPMRFVDLLSFFVRCCYFLG